MPMEELQDSWSPYLKALYWDKKGNWTKAHEIIQDLETKEAAWIHAYLHRKEGDEWNAGYWYRRAHQEFFKGSLDQEWSLLWNHFNETSLN